MPLKSKVALITGGGSGIGRATALLLARSGAAVVVGNRNADQGEAVVAEIRGGGGRAIFQRTDVTRAEQVEALVERAVKEFGRLDLAVNNAGVDAPVVPLQDLDLAAASQVMAVNVTGVFYSMKYEIARMLGQGGGGAIVNTTSVLGINGAAGMAMYVASKHAVSGMTKSAALENAKTGIRVNAVAPGPIETPMLSSVTGGNPHAFGEMVPMGRIGRPEEIAEAIVWLLSDAASYITGHILPIDGGWGAQ